MLEYTKGTQSTPSVAFILITVTVMKTQVIMKSYKKLVLTFEIDIFFFTFLGLVIIIIMKYLLSADH